MKQQEQQQEFEVIVVGAGMVGLTAALALADQGFNVAVLDRSESTAQMLIAQTATRCDEDYDNRVSALTVASQRILEKLGVWEKLAAIRLSPYRRMHVWDGQGSGEISFSADELYQPCLGHIVENSTLVAALYQALAQHSVTMISGAEVKQLELERQSRQVICQDGRVFTAALVVGADGAMSKVRHLARLPMWQWDYGHHAIVATVCSEIEHADTAWQRFTEDGPLAFLPLKNKHFCSIVWSTSAGHATELMALDEGAFGQRLQAAFAHHLGKVRRVDNRACFPLRQRHAMQYVQPGLAVIGDAAHTIHPLAGQGVNLGLLDAAVLCETLKKARQRGENYASLRVLKKFQRLRQADNMQMSAMMQGFKWLFDPQPAPVMLMRSLGMNLLDKAVPVKQHVVQQAMGLSGNLPSLARP